MSSKILGSKFSRLCHKWNAKLYHLQIVSSYCSEVALSTGENHLNSFNQHISHKKFPKILRTNKRLRRSVFFQKKSSFRSFSSNTATSDFNNDHPVIFVKEDGTELSIEFFRTDDEEKECKHFICSSNTTENSQFSTFHAPWLWSNCPNHIHFTGARKRTPGRYPGTKISSAHITPASDLILGKFCNKIESVSSDIPIPPPPIYSCHPTLQPFLNGDRSKASYFQAEKQLILCVSWDDNSHDSYFDLNWLGRWRYDIQSLNKRKNRTEVSSKHALQTNDELFRISFDEFDKEYQGNATYEVLNAVFQVGAAIVSGVPNVENDKTHAVKFICDALAGATSHGNLYGDIFHVKNKQKKESTNNIAYTSEPLVPHQDLSYYESKPGLQLLHCVEFGDDIMGGESILIDALAAAAEFRRIAPHHFRTLASCSASFVKQRKDVCMTYLQPHIVLQNNVQSSASSNQYNSMKDDDILNAEIVAVNWSPPFEGPLCIPPDLIIPYYDAYAAFEQMIDFTIPPAHLSVENDEDLNEINKNNLYSDYARRFTWKYKLKPGEMLVFNNQRLLHGRKGFRMTRKSNGVTNSNTSNVSLSRHLIGAYTNIDDTFNKYRILHYQRLGSNSIGKICNVGNGTSIIP